MKSSLMVTKEMLFLIPIAIIFVTMCKGISTFLHSFQMNKVAHSVIAKLQSEMFEKLMYFNLKFLMIQSLET